jgi:hypothetical protein
MKNILIGSRAMDYWLFTGSSHADSDYDIISSTPIEGAEFHDRFFLNNDDFDGFTNDNHVIIFQGKIVHVMNPYGLAIIKRSHLHRDLSFSKHITHYHKYLSNYIDSKSPLLKERIEMTHLAFPQQGPNLSLTKDEFFNDAVTKKYDHDWLHELFAYENHPMYTKLQKGENNVKCYLDLWYNLTHEQKLQCVQEETYVLSTERFLVPLNFKYSKKLAYIRALQKVCTTVCKGWFRDFAIDNYPVILSNFNESKVQKVQLILERNTHVSYK